MPAATATFKDRKPGCIGIATRAAAASWTWCGTPALSDPKSRTSPAANAKSGSGVAPAVVSSTSRRAPICDHRSEEHTSELQSLMRISYAVFCLKKKKNRKEEETAKERKSTTIQSTSNK